MIFSFIIQSLACIFLLFGGKNTISNHGYFVVAFLIMGFGQAFVYPINVSVIGSWFTKKSRGLIGGCYGTSSNVGNIIGIQFAAYMQRKTPDTSWWYLFAIQIGVNIFFILCVFFLYKPYPDAQEIIIHKEELIDYVYKLQQNNPEAIKKRKAQDGDTNLFSYGARSVKSLGDNSARAALR